MNDRVFNHNDIFVFEGSPNEIFEWFSGRNPNMWRYYYVSLARDGETTWFLHYWMMVELGGDSVISKKDFNSFWYSLRASEKADYEEETRKSIKEKSANLGDRMSWV
jgi:hypothetical protein